MSIAMVAPGVPMRAGGKSVLWRGLRGNGAAGGGFAGPFPNAIPGLSGWWDAGLTAALLDPAGVPIPGWSSAIGSLADKSGNGQALAPYHFLANATPAPTIATPRLSGLLGGVGAPVALASYAPTLDMDWGLTLPALSFAPMAGWTRYLVWSRPNWRQGTSYANAAPITLIHAGAPVVQAGSTDGTLTLFPGTASATVLSTALTRRHTHSLVLRNTPGAGVDAWLDGTQVATGIASPLGTGPCVLLHDTTLQGSAQCWFHEFATWERPLAADEIATLLAAATRWVRGARRGITALVTGQSNAEWFTQAGGAAALVQGVAWYTGALAANVISVPAGSYNAPARYTTVAGHPVSNSSPPLFPPGAGAGTFLTDPGDGSSPAAWAPGADGFALQSFLTGASAVANVADEADIAFLLWPWTEQDSTRPYADKAAYQASLIRLAGLLRGWLNRSAASLPLLLWNAIPYQTNPGVQMAREAVAALAADPAQNAWIFAPNTAASAPLNSSYDPATGLATGGDPNHRDQTDHLQFGRRGAHVARLAATASGLADSIAAAPAGLPSAGPRIVHAYRESDTSIIITVQHDAGTDIKLPLQAANGAGWAVMDGGSLAATPGPIIPALAAARMDPTHLRLTLAQPISQPSAAVGVFYPYGSTQIGRGDAITDNWADLPKPAGWDIGADLGAAWNTDFPLQATTAPIPLSDTP
ncbi:MAG TPA: hypothetical protein VMU82_07885 [Acetobacteraceae bacterium]|nr:hypothetical protein [Acetobacteraceae bacterium]